MLASQKYNILMLLVGIGLIYWSTLPDEHLVIDKSCNIVGIRNQIAEKVYGDSFWRLQLKAVDESLGWLQRAPAAAAHDLEGQSRNFVEERMARLSDNHGSNKEEAKARETRERYDNIAWLSACDAMIRTRLRD